MLTYNYPINPIKVLIFLPSLMRVANRNNQIMKTLKTILVYVFALICLPWTLFRSVIASILIVDSWCEKIINNWLKEVNKDLKMNEPKDKHCTCNDTPYIIRTGDNGKEYCGLCGKDLE